MLRLRSDPQSGRLVALRVPGLLLGFNVLTVYFAWLSIWDNCSFFLFYWGLNLLYALYSVPLVILLLLPAVKRRCCAESESESAVSVHPETNKVSPRHRRCVIIKVLVSMALVLVVVNAGLLTPYFFSARLAESEAPNYRSRIIVLAYDMYGTDNVGIYCWPHGRPLPQRIKVTSSSGDIWCYPEAEITWVGNTATINVIGDGCITDTFEYTPE